MPVYKNISKANLVLPRENGLKPDLELLPDRTFNGSEDFYNKYVTENLIQRTTDGWSYNGVIETGPDTLTINVDGFIQEDGIVALTSDATINSQISDGTYYSCFGKIIWYEGDIEYQAYFSIIGNGTHGADATFSIDADSTPAGATSLPIVAGSEIDINSGIITFALSGATMRDATAEIIYNASQEGYRLGIYKNELLNSPFFSTIQTVTADNQITSKKIFYTGSKAGDPAKLITMTYTGTQTEPDTIKEEPSIVTALDLSSL